MIITTNPHFSQNINSRDSLPTESSNYGYRAVELGLAALDSFSTHIRACFFINDKKPLLTKAV